MFVLIESEDWHSEIKFKINTWQSLVMMKMSSTRTSGLFLFIYSFFNLVHEETANDDIQAIFVTTTFRVKYKLHLCICFILNNIEKEIRICAERTWCAFLWKFWLWLIFFSQFIHLFVVVHLIFSVACRHRDRMNIRFALP